MSGPDPPQRLCCFQAIWPPEPVDHTVTAVEAFSSPVMVFTGAAEGGIIKLVPSFHPNLFWPYNKPLPHEYLQGRWTHRAASLSPRLFHALQSPLHLQFLIVFCTGCAAHGQVERSRGIPRAGFRFCWFCWSVAQQLPQRPLSCCRSAAEIHGWCVTFPAISPSFHSSYPHCPSRFFKDGLLVLSRESLLSAGQLGHEMA